MLTKIKFAIKIFERLQTLLNLKNEYFDKKEKPFLFKPFLRKFKNIPNVYIYFHDKN